MLKTLTIRVAATKKKITTLATHPSNAGLRSRKFLSMLRFEARAARGLSTELKFGDGLRVIAAKNGDSSSRIAYANLPDWPYMAVWMSWLGPDDSFVDVGGNVGLYSLIAAQRGCSVVAYEPAADMVEALRRNSLLNALPRIDVRAAAVLDARGTVSLSGPDPNRMTAEASCSGTVPAVTLDDEFADSIIRGMKIDVEGNERLVLEGYTEGLRLRRCSLIQLEWNTSSFKTLGESREPVADLLWGAGFSLVRWEGGSIKVYEPGTYPATGDDIFAALPEAEQFLSANFATVVQTSQHR